MQHDVQTPVRLGGRGGRPPPLGFASLRALWRNKSRAALTALGVFSGFQPARRASRLRPIEALRYE